MYSTFRPECMIFMSSVWWWLLPSETPMSIGLIPLTSGCWVPSIICWCSCSCPQHWTAILRPYPSSKIVMSLPSPVHSIAIVICLSSAPTLHLAAWCRIPWSWWVPIVRDVCFWGRWVLSWPSLVFSPCRLCFRWVLWLWGLVIACAWCTTFPQMRTCPPTSLFHPWVCLFHWYTCFPSAMSHTRCCSTSLPYLPTHTSIYYTICTSLSTILLYFTTSTIVSFFSLWSPVLCSTSVTSAMMLADCIPSPFHSGNCSFVAVFVFSFGTLSCSGSLMHWWPALSSPASTTTTIV